MPGVSEEEIRHARQMTAIEYLKRYQPYRLKKSSTRNEWELTDHDSFKINEITSKWHWKSRDIGGTSALNFLIYVDGRGFVDAVRELCGEQPSYYPPIVEKKERKPFVLPEGNPDCKRVIRYLQNRGISLPVIEYCIQSEILYESAPYHNAVSIGKDEKKIPRYAFLRGIYDSGGRSFKMEQAGSEKAFGFCILWNEKEQIKVLIDSLKEFQENSTDKIRKYQYKLIADYLSEALDRTKNLQ